MKEGEEWYAAVQGVSRIRHNLATEQQQLTGVLRIDLLAYKMVRMTPGL